MAAPRYATSAAVDFLPQSSSVLLSNVQSIRGKINDHRDACLLFTKTWLNENNSDVDIIGFCGLLRLDKSTTATGKVLGGVCFHVNII